MLCQDLPRDRTVVPTRRLSSWARCSGPPSYPPRSADPGVKVSRAPPVPAPVPAPAPCWTGSAVRAGL